MPAGADSLEPLDGLAAAAAARLASLAPAPPLPAGATTTPTPTAHTLLHAIPDGVSGCGDGAEGAAQTSTLPATVQAAVQTLPLDRAPPGPMGWKVVPSPVTSAEATEDASPTAAGNPPAVAVVTDHVLEPGAISMGIRVQQQSGDATALSIQLLRYEAEPSCVPPPVFQRFQELLPHMGLPAAPTNNTTDPTVLAPHRPEVQLIDGVVTCPMSALQDVVLALLTTLASCTPCPGSGYRVVGDERHWIGEIGHEWRNATQDARVVARTEWMPPGLLGGFDTSRSHHRQLVVRTVRCSHWVLDDGICPECDHYQAVVRVRKSRHLSTAATASGEVVLETIAGEVLIPEKVLHKHTKISTLTEVRTWLLL